MMDKTIQAGLMMVKKHFKVTEQSVGDFETIRMYGIMKFKVKRYDIEGLGNLSVMTVNMGVMKMSTFVITPFDRDMPLLSMDFMYIMKKRKAYVEIYDLVRDADAVSYQVILMALKKVLDGFQDLEELPYGENWYDDLLNVKTHKTGTAKQEERFYDLFKDTVELYAKTAASMRILSRGEMEEKKKIIRKYCEDMVEKGGVSTSMFKKAKGDAFTKEFFEKVFFGTAAN